MLTELRNGRIVDPLHPLHGQTASLYIRDGRFVDAPGSTSRKRPGVADQVVPNHVIELDNALVLAGGIDIHTHIGGGKVNLARMLMAEQSLAERSVWPTPHTGMLYNQMGYTSCFEPAMVLSTARHTHLELADTPYLDSGAYVVLGNEDWLLESLGRGLENSVLDAWIAWAVNASQALAVKVVNPGGISAFKFNQRTLDVDEPHVAYGVTPRQVIARLTAAVDRLQLPHPLHLHASNLGMPGNVQAALAILDAAEGRRLHLTHAQFNSYSSDGPMGMGSGAQQLADYVNAHDNISLDVGQVVFGQTVTISADAQAQYRNRRYAQPKQWLVSDTECQAGCGVVPIKYQDRQYVHSLQWTIGLELMLLVEDPWRVFLTTDHPNGGPFTSYPHLIRLLMDRTFRQSVLETIHPLAAERSLLNDIEREYTLDEIALVTRAAPARILGLADRGTLTTGALADVAVYRRKADWEQTFTTADHVLKRGVSLVEQGQCTGATVLCETLTARPEFELGALRSLRSQVEQTLRHPLQALEIGDAELGDLIRRPQGYAGPCPTSTLWGGGHAD
ncbi:formylmethanofuran dehydrogenase subunit A [Aureliella helgolandensis]|uniref:Formyltransferase/hydrolase complex Fhc subunit A n=1 Tax=Aureliella helgolandensis TaxID=2527968 RepID=A0A518G0R3_9BACT|nr:formylmethanofuran dehydrogenase subunit A [Aureliella helgolandensis]QDV22166.1 Formyltransferase/hydrolase complex Fhc subunit A [Aureliella helgolandensis]